MAIAALSGWTREQKHVVVASFLGWSLDAFDFFLLVFVLKISLRNSRPISRTSRLPFS